jgi:molybdate transport system ATP-binding protein
MTAMTLTGTTSVGSLDLDLDLTVHPGETIALLGPNGAGKSSLLRLMVGLVRLTSGSLRLGDVTVDEPDAGTFVEPHRRGVAWVPQGTSLFPHLSVADNVGFAPGADGALVAGLIERFGLAELADRRPHQCSGGQAQRVAVARALAADPKVLLLDEPATALDLDSRRSIHTALTDGDRPTTLIVTHDPVEAAVLADRVAIVEEGRIAQVGSPDEIRRRPAGRFAASLSGLNLIEAVATGDVAATPSGAVIVLAEPFHGPVRLAIPPGAIALHRSVPDGSPRNVWRATIADVQPVLDRVRVVLDGPLPVVAEVTPGAVEVLELKPGARMWAAVKATEIACHRA